ncbi:MAG TPA: NFACT RNA binding domain-containing protein [Syntrophomonadaceae bacterium]|nr:NFACT RNA binding domain-containing protein [Syntrophomonadaceae bacterium]
MPFDGLTIRGLCRELNDLLFNARIDKIHQPEKDDLVFSIRQSGNGTFRLLISANARWARLQLTGEKGINPITPPAFCMFLRKHLEGGKIKAVSQEGFDRIIHIHIEALDDFREWRNKLLICEFMGKHSNIILVNPETGIIMDAIRKYGSDLSTYREVLPGKEYLLPPGQGKLNPLTASYEEFAALMYSQNEQITLSSALFHTFSGLSQFSCREICSAAGLDEALPLEECGSYEFNALYTYLRTLLQDLYEGRVRPEVVYLQKHPQEFAPYEISAWPQGKKMYFASLIEACQRYFDDRIGIARLESMRANLSRHIKDVLEKAYRKRFHQEGDLHQAGENKKYKIWGELLTAYAHELVKGQPNAQLNDFYSGESVEIPLDPRFTPIKNAQRYFKIYNKSTRAVKYLYDLISKNQQEIDYLESVLVAIEQAEIPSQLEEIIEELEKEGVVKEKGKGKRRRAAPVHSQPRRYMSSDGLEIMVGRNNRQNDQLTLKLAAGHDLWLHTKEVPGTHVIVKLGPEMDTIFKVPDRTLEEAAALAAHFSKAGLSDKVGVDYTFRYNVKKPGGARPGMVIYDNYWTILVNPRNQVLEPLPE